MPAAGSSAISTGPTGAGGAGSSAIEEGWCRLTVTHNVKNSLHQNASKMTVIDGKPGNLYAKAMKHQAALGRKSTVEFEGLNKIPQCANYVCNENRT